MKLQSCLNLTELVLIGTVVAAVKFQVVNFPVGERLSIELEIKLTSRVTCAGFSTNVFVQTILETFGMNLENKHSNLVQLV